MYTRILLDTALFGAIFVLFCDILARVFVYPYELSVGLTVGVIGSGMFLYLVLRRNHMQANLREK